MNDAQPGKPAARYLPQPGERVLIRECHGFEEFVGQVCTVDRASRFSASGNGETLLRFRDDGPGKGVGVWCRVSPLPSSPLDVECPVEGCVAVGPCLQLSGRAYLFHEGSRVHILRHEYFLALTGQKDSVPVAPVSPMDGGAAGVANVGSERGDSGTGRAAGSERSASAEPASSGAGFGPVSQPAAPSGFVPPTHIHQVPCPLCPTTATVAHCRNPDGTQYTDEKGGHYHALRVAAFKAREVKPEAPKRAFERCRECDQEIRSYSDEATERQVAIGECVDCMIDTPWQQKRAILRASLDRPLPRKVAEAERIWPEGGGDYEL